jgi:hypothetical protein
MERLWSRAGATGGNRWKMRRPRKRLKHSKIVAVGCDPDRRDDTWPLLATSPRMRSRDRDRAIFTLLSARCSGSP